jgi:hypothetical protein
MHKKGSIQFQAKYLSSDLPLLQLSSLALLHGNRAPAISLYHHIAANSNILRRPHFPSPLPKFSVFSRQSLTSSISEVNNTKNQCTCMFQFSTHTSHFNSFSNSPTFKISKEYSRRTRTWCRMRTSTEAGMCQRFPQLGQLHIGVTITEWCENLARIQPANFFGNYMTSLHWPKYVKEREHLVGHFH